MNRGMSIKTALGVSTILGLILTMPAWAKGKTGCTNIPVQVTISPVSNTAFGGIYGDGKRTDSSGNTVYTNGQDGATATLNICDTNYELLLNLINTTRYYWVDFDDPVVAANPGATVPTSPYTYKASVINVHEVANLKDYSNFSPSTGGQLQTCMSGGVSGLSARLTTSIHFTYQSLWAVNNGICPDATVQKTADDGGATNTSVIQVTVAPNCASWTITPVPVVAESGAPDAPTTGLVEVTSNNTYYFGGNYSMPFQITVTRLDGGGCTGLPQ